jgi:hypothetical protein
MKNKKMKEILYSATLILLLYILYVDNSITNLLIVAISLVILIIYATQFKKNTKEHFSIVSSLDTNMFNDDKFKETLSLDMKTDLVYYISSFDKKFIDFENNIMIDIVNNESGALLKGIKYENYFQYDGVRIQRPVECPNAKTLLETFDSFSVFWYMKLITPSSYFTSDSEYTFSILQFDHDNIMTRNEDYTLFDIRLTFSRDNLNPTISILIVNQVIASYTYSQEDYHNNKIFADGKHHLFTFVKDHGKVNFYVDNHKYIDCSDEECFKVDTIRLIESNPEEISIRPSLLRMNNYANTSSQNALTLYLNAFGVYRRRVLTSDDVVYLSNYFKNIKRNLQPEMITLSQSNKELTKELYNYKKACPFSNEAVCAVECSGIQNWGNIPELVENAACFTKAVNYCNSLSNLDDDRMCSYIKTDHIFKMASAIDSNLFMYNPKNKTNLDDDVNTNILHKLDQLGLKNIYLDKSYRDANGKYSGEIQRLINDLTKTNQTINADTLNALHESNADTKVTSDIDYNNLMNNKAFSNDMSYDKMYNELLATQKLPTEDSKITEAAPSNVITKGLHKDFIDLSYDDIQKPDVYNHLLKKHKEEKIEDEIDSWKFSNLLTWWF